LCSKDIAISAATIIRFNMDWFVYILSCSDHSYYVGLTNNLELRVMRHNAGQGAKYTRGRLPVKLIWSELHESKSSALRREIQIKGWRRDKKELLLKANSSFEFFNCENN
jgi:predicted GIY-YIG superfamily endonuclease